MISWLYWLLYKTKRTRWRLFIYRSVKITLNFIYPLYCRLTRARRPTNSSLKHNKEVIVSLTSFPARIKKVWVIVETLLRQSYKPEKIILWLADSQFDSIDQLPKRLRKQQTRGLEIKFCEDLRSHKKYYYAMLNFPDAIIITVDDDTFYPEDLVHNLVTTHRRYPDAICCYYAHHLTTQNKSIAPYANWQSGADGFDEPAHGIVPIGCEGVLYPPLSLHSDVFDKQKILELCPYADDLWLKAMASLNGRKAVKCFRESITFANLIDWKNINLHSINAGQNMNDIQLAKIMKQYPQLHELWNVKQMERAL